MKLRAFLLGCLATMMFVGVALAASSQDELVLDWPHNEDNGIYCFHCHSEDPETGDDWWVTTQGAPTDPDFSVANWVCKRCHVPAGATAPIESLDPAFGIGANLVGPTKTLHSSSTTDSTKGTWTTQCIDCHDPHFQTQKDWGGTGGETLPVLYIATGVFDTSIPGGALAFDAGDQLLGGPLGTSSIGISNITINAPTGFSPPETTWVNKGKTAGFEDRDNRASGGHTRGLILVVDTLNPSTSRTFEIVQVTPSGGGYVLKVNGDLTHDHNPSTLDPSTFVPGVENGRTFGVLYGAAIRKDALTPTGYKPVKFFNPNHTPGTYGGTVDLTATTEPVGLCQVCHDSANTVYYDSTTDENADTNHHVNDSTECVDCHDILEGAAPRKDHTNGAVPFITIDATANACAACHLGYNTAPDTAHVLSAGGDACKTCHTLAPDMNATTDLRTPYSNTGAVHGVTVYCITCHNASYGGVDYPTEHPTASQDGVKDTKHNNALATTQTLCVGCHGPFANGIAIVADGAVPGGHNDTCTHCHLTVTPSPVELTPMAQQARDVDGFSTAQECWVCHTAEFPGHLHPQHATTVVVNSVGSPKTVNCVGCHTNAPAGNGPFIGTGEVHSQFGCATCHNTVTDGQLKGSAASVNGADPNLIPPADGFYECAECHINHFNGHDRGTNEYNVGNNWHDVRFVEGTDVTGGGTDCFKCHDDAGLGKGTNALSTWAAILTEHQTIGGTGGQNACEVCHNSSNVSGDPDTPVPADVYAKISGGVSVTCIGCHVAKNGPHGSHLPAEFAWTDAGNNTKATCGTAGCHDWINNQNVVLDIHGNGTADNESATSPACPECHVNAAANDYTRTSGTDGNALLGTAGDRQRDCLVCHTGTLEFMHHVKHSTQLPFTVDNCAAKCHKTGAYVADHFGDGFNGMVVDALDNGIDRKDCSYCHSSTFGASADGNNIPVDVTPTPGNLLHDACTTCHVVNEANNNIVELVPAGGFAAAMPIGLGEGGTDGGGTCVACHTTYFEAHTHHTNVSLNQVAINYSDTTGFNVIDQSWSSYASCGTTTECHFDYEAAPPAGGNAPAGTALDTWLGIQTEHDRVGTPLTNGAKDGVGSCVNCHYLDAREGINLAKFSPGTTVAAVTAYDGAVNCLDCHFAKQSPSNHGMIYVNHFEWNTTGQIGVVGGYNPISDNTGCTTTCHPAGTDVSGKPDPIIGLHQNPSCDICHTSQPLLLDTPNFAEFGQPVTLDLNGVDCTECHRDTHSPFHNVDPANLTTQGVHNQMHNLSDNPNYSDGSSSGYFCLDCHLEMSDMETVLGRHMPGFADMSDCNVCHYPDTYSTDKAIVPAIPETTAQTVIQNGKAGTVKVPGGDVYQACEFCHTVKDTGVGFGYRLHGMTADIGPDGVAAEHDKIISAGVVPVITGTDTDCANCHSMATPTEMLNLHMGTGPAESQHSGTCLTCHLPSNSVDLLADSPSLGVISSGVSGTSKYCNECHTASGDYLMHSLAFDASIATDHDKLDISTGIGGDCASCHTMTTPAERLTLHNKPGVYCSGCHNNATLNPAKTVIDAGWSDTTQTPAKCEHCHDGLNQYRLHGMNDSDAAGVHDHIFSDNTTPDINCNQCHDMSTNLKIIQLHTAPKNIDTLGAKSCLTCHLPGPSTAATVIANGQGGVAGANQNCSDCHTGPGIYLMHGLAFGTGADKAVHDNLDVSTDVTATKNNCAQCHSMATSENRLDLHSVVGCSICHNNGTDFATANTAITLAWDDTVPTPAKCEACHSGTNYTNHSLLATDGALITLHDKLGPEVSASSSCGTSTCHDNNTDTKILAFHAAPTSDDCLICHTSTAGVQSVINLAKGGGAGSALCEDCHIGGAGLPDIANDWFLHVDYAGGIDHTTANLVDTPTITTPPTVNCTSTDCHGGVDLIDAGQPGVGVHDMGDDLSKTYSCALCHDSAGLLTGNAFGNGGGAECLTCHGAYFDSHTQRVLGSGGHEAYYTPGVGEDWTQQGTPCGNCHKDRTDNTPTVDMLAWDGILIEHDLTGGKDGVSACITCHNYDVATWINNQTVVPGDVTTAIGTTGNTCGSCHDDKAQGGPTAGTTEDHGGHTAADFPWTDTLCAGCHQAAPWGIDVVNDVHGPNYSTNCLPCHTGGVAGAALQGSALNITWGAGPDACTDCHTGGFGLHTTHTVSKPNAVKANTASTPITATCNTSGCHDTSGVKPFITGATATPVHLSCFSCHAAADGSLISVAASKNGGLGGECNVCHDTMFEGHDWGLDTSGTKAHDTQKVATDLAQSTPTTCSANGCHQDFNPGNTNSLDTWEGVLYEHDKDGTKDGVGACVYCHDNDTYSSVDTVKGYSGNIQDVIMNPLGTTPLVECLDCHYDKKSPAAHGGHDITQFPWTAMSSAGKTTCGSSVNGTSCHDDSAAVIGSIHNGNIASGFGSICLVCHTGTGGGDGTMRPYDAGTMLGDPNQGIGSNALHDDIQCVTCHTKTKGEIHHTSADAPAGNCIACHMPDVGVQSPLAARGDIMMPPNLACNWCHLWWPNNIDYLDQASDLGYKTDDPSAPGKVMIYKLTWDPETNQRTYATRTPIPSHAISTNSVTPINDYGACFACHGATGVAKGAAGADMVKPFHGLGRLVTSTVADANASGSNLLPDRHLNNFFAGPQQTGASGTEKTDPYHPGYGAFNWLSYDEGTPVRIVSSGQGEGSKIYATSDKANKFIHQSEEPIRRRSVRNCDIVSGAGTTSIEWNNWGADLNGTTGSVTVNSGGLEGANTIPSDMPLVNLSIPTNVSNSQAACP